MPDAAAISKPSVLHRKRKVRPSADSDAPVRSSADCRALAEQSQPRGIVSKEVQDEIHHEQSIESAVFR